MRTPLLFICAWCMLVPLFGQDLTRKGTPWVVSHLSAENNALLRRKASPKHSVFSKVVCFKTKCRSFAGWRRNQRSIRFKGYKQGALPPAPQNKQVQKDTLIVKQTPARDNVITPQSGTDQLFVLDEVLFEHNSARLNEALTYKLDSLVDLVSASAQATVQITGHTDNTGSAEHNIRLSTARAQAVAEYLVESGVHPGRINFQGMGSGKPVASNDSDLGRAKNRRVEILLSSEMK